MTKFGYTILAFSFVSFMIPTILLHIQKTKERKLHGKARGSH